MKMEVYCSCCTPVQLLGWLNVNANDNDRGYRTVSFRLTRLSPDIVGHGMTIETETTCVEILDVALMADGDHRPYQILVSRQIPCTLALQTLRRINGFIEKHEN